MPCSLAEVHHFGKVSYTFRVKEHAKKRVSKTCLLLACCSLGLHFISEDRAVNSSKFQGISIGLHGITSQKIVSTLRLKYYIMKGIWTNTEYTLKMIAKS
jgi:hypothetical protein